MILGALVWLLVSLPLALLLGRVIRLADDRSTARNRAVADTPKITRAGIPLPRLPVCIIGGTARPAPRTEPLP